MATQAQCSAQQSTIETLTADLSDTLLDTLDIGHQSDANNAFAEHLTEEICAEKTGNNNGSCQHNLGNRSGVI